ncbi:MAG: prevent-host-death protein [Candidatus Kapabacteria bacterium]|nr:prevent-host-death protein [Candidatus Kapabacteria bacterium]
MIIISSREFRQNQKYYLDLIDKNEHVIIQRGKDKSYKISAVDADERLMSEAEFIEKIKKSIQQAKDGKLKLISKEHQNELLGL